MIGTTISHYKILEKLGEGGMGIVYKAQDLKLDRFVALKFLPPTFGIDEESKQRFIHEAKFASSLQHQNICTIHEIDETEEGQLFICMDYYEGETLKKKIQKRLLRIEDILEISVQLLNGLSVAHEKGIIHRDIKPANIFITNNNEVKILDFGLAKSSAYTKITRIDGTTHGTVAYISPEQAQGKEATHQSDIWSFCVVLFELLTGDLPFKGEYDQVLIYSVLDREPEKITSLNSETPVELEYIVGRGLEKDLESRYQNVEEILIDLTSFKEKATISNGTQSIIERKANKKRLKSIAILTVTVISVILFYLIIPIILGEKKQKIPISIAVISFENQTGDSSYNYLQKAIPNLLITNLEQSENLQVTTWERMYDLLKQIDKNEVDLIDKDLGFEVCNIEGIDVIVLGSFIKAGDVFATDVKVLDVSNKKIIKSANTKSEGLASILEIQIDYLSEEIAEGIGLSASEIESVQLRIAEVSTTSIEAYNHFLSGRDEFEKRYFNNARQCFERAIELDSTFAVSHLYLAWVYSYLRYVQKEEKAYERAKAFSKKATNKERLYIEAAYAHSIEKNSAKRFHILKQLVKEYPKEKRSHTFWLLLSEQNDV